MISLTSYSKWFCAFIWDIDTKKQQNNKNHTKKKPKKPLHASPYVLLFYCCCNELAQNKWLKSTKLTALQYCRWKVPNGSHWTKVRALAGLSFFGHSQGGICSIVFSSFLREPIFLGLCLYLSSQWQCIFLSLFKPNLSRMIAERILCF